MKNILEAGAVVVVVAVVGDVLMASVLALWRF
jgi:hypothetical protein